jgi:hypothetical protein
MSDDDHVRKAAATALGNIGSANQKAALSEDDPDARTAKKFFQLLDRDADGTASVEELSKLQKLRPKFEEAGVSLDKDMSEKQFVDAYLKANR